MAAEWHDIKIEELASPVQGGIAIGPFGSRMKSDCYVTEGVRVVRGTNLNEGRTFRGEFVFITEEKARSLGSSMLQPYDLVFPHRGSIGEVGIVPDDGLGYVMSTSLMKLTCDQSKARPDFLYYFFRSDIGRHALLQNQSQVGTPGIGQPLTSLKSITIRLPDLVEQDAVAALLRTLDGKIEILKKTNETIEAIAQAIFKFWFVDFDPVRAKGEGREPEGMDADTAALFPSTFEDSELGPIPQGWTTGPITNVLSLNPTRSLKKKVAATYLDMASVPTSGPRATSWIKRDFVSGSKFINGDTLLARITPCLENGKTAYVDFLEQDEVGWGSTEFIVMATKPNVPSQFAYLLARDPEFRQYAIQSMSGTSGRQRVQVDQLAMFKIAIANDSIYRAFGTLVEPLFQRIKYSSEEQTTLTALRDTLLPRLISGKLRVPEAEAMLMEVV